MGEAGRVRVEFHTGDEDPDFLFEAHHAEQAGGWVPVIGDLVVWERIEWIVTERVWCLEQGEEPVLAVWMRKT
jgi:hypothetical protein